MQDVVGLGRRRRHLSSPWEPLRLAAGDLQISAGHRRSGQMSVRMAHTLLSVVGMVAVRAIVIAVLPAGLLGEDRDFALRESD